MSLRRPDEQGSAGVLVIAVLAALAALAVIVVSIASSGKWTAFSEYSHSRAFYSADAASEEAINWLRNQPTPPPLVDANSNVLVAASYASLGTNHRYKSDIQFVRKHFRPGWSTEYRDYEFRIKADGASARAAEAAVDVQAMRLYREGY